MRCIEARCDLVAASFPQSSEHMPQYQSKCLFIFTNFEENSERARFDEDFFRDFLNFFLSSEGPHISGRKAQGKMEPDDDVVSVRVTQKEYLERRGVKFANNIPQKKLQQLFERKFLDFACFSAFFWTFGRKKKKRFSSLLS